ncbi:MAG TPA: hypothetical protein VHI13_16335 [Candidatus Kapabacteria bacterium]|nr:hypothetical protein [Candidatus Kapabacteria bacterium]
MMSIRINTYRTLGGLALAAALGAAALGAASCGTTGPDESMWQNVASYSWPTTVADTFVYVREQNLQSAPDTLTVRAVVLDSSINSMSVLRQGNTSTLRLYRPTPDTLFTASGIVPVRYALVAPLTTGQSWGCAFDDSMHATWQATITERNLYQNIGGTVYSNVIVVEYTPTKEEDRIGPTKTWSWTCFYARGFGPVRMIRQTATKPDATSPAYPRPEEIWTFVKA